MKKLCQVNPTAKTNRLWNYRLPEHFDCIQFLISHPVVPSHCVECRVSLKADFISGMWSSIYKCTSLLNSSVINIAHQYCMDSGHWTSFQIRVTVSMKYALIIWANISCLFVDWVDCLQFRIPFMRKTSSCERCFILNVAVVTNLDLWTFLQIWLCWMM